MDGRARFLGRAGFESPVGWAGIFGAIDPEPTACGVDSKAWSEVELLGMDIGFPITGDFIPTGD